MYWLVSLPLWVHGHEVKGYAERGLYLSQGSYYILQFEGPILNTWKEELRSIGIKFYDYLPKYAFIVKATEEQLQKAYNKPFVLRIIPMLPQYKLPKDYKSKLNTCYIKQGDLYKVRVLVYEPHQLKLVQSFIQSKGFKVEGVSDKYVLYVQANLPLNLIHELTNLDFVKFVEFRYPIVNWNDLNAILHQSGKFDSLTTNNPLVPEDTIVWMKGIRGEGQVLGHNDDELEATNCFFDGTVDGQNKIVDLCNYDAGGCGQASLPIGSGHGTHTAGTAVGGVDAPLNTNSTAFKGLAYKARIVSQVPLGGGGAGFGTVLQDAYNRGARVHTNSWGSVCIRWIVYPILWERECAPYDYNTDAIAIDNFVWNNPDMLVVFAAGNHGDDNNNNGCTIQGCSYAASNPATAKSDITVGAMERTTDAKVSWSAYGNYPSGRFSVDIIAHGVTTWSACSEGADPTCANSCAIAGMSGTSMATPAVAGMALLIRQYYLEGWYGNGTKNSAPSHNPSAALVRASLLASAVPISADRDDGGDDPVPNGNEGAGRPVLDNFMYFEPEDSWNSLADSSDERKSRLEFWDITPGLNTGEADTFKVYIVNPNMVTRFVLSWSDTAASEGCGTGGGCLVNDLDLIVVDSATGDTWYGNVQTTGADNLTPANTGSPDRANTWELVRIKNRTGTFYVIVNAFNTPQGPQPYAVVVSGGLGDPIVTPLAVDESKGNFRITYRDRKLLLSTPYDARFRIKIYDLAGKLILDRNVPSKNNKAILELKDISRGTYVLKIYLDNSKLYETKFVLH